MDKLAPLGIGVSREKREIRGCPACLGKKEKQANLASTVAFVARLNIIVIIIGHAKMVRSVTATRKRIPPRTTMIVTITTMMIRMVDSNIMVDVVEVVVGDAADEAFKAYLVLQVLLAPLGRLVFPAQWVQLARRVPMAPTVSMDCLVNRVNPDHLVPMGPMETMEKMENRVWKDMSVRPVPWVPLDQYQRSQGPAGRLGRLVLLVRQAPRVLLVRQGPRGLRVPWVAPGPPGQYLQCLGRPG